MTNLGTVYACEADRLKAEAKAFEAVKATEAALAAAKQALIDVRNAATTNAEKEDDTTKIGRVPIDSTGNPSTVTVDGLFIPKQAAQTSEEIPWKSLDIAEDTLLHSGGFIQARFRYDLITRSKIVYIATLDGHDMVPDRVTDESWVEAGMNIIDADGQGYTDENIFEWPNHAWAKKGGPHTIGLKVGLVENIVEGNTHGANEGLGLLTWDKIRAVKEYTFPVNLIPRTDLG